MNRRNEDAINLHRSLRGKIEIHNRVSIDTGYSHEEKGTLGLKSKVLAIKEAIGLNSKALGLKSKFGDKKDTWVKIQGFHDKRTPLV